MKNALNRPRTIIMVTVGSKVVKGMKEQILPTFNKGSVQLGKIRLSWPINFNSRN